MDQAALIELVRQYEHIYRKKHRDFKNKLARENAWKTIASILNFPSNAYLYTTVFSNSHMIFLEEDVETTWNSLRNRFATEKRKMRCIPTGSAARTEWRYYDAMSFLEEHVAVRK